MSTEDEIEAKARELGYNYIQQVAAVERWMHGKRNMVDAMLVWAAEP
jgi:hypothetical protein